MVGILAAMAFVPDQRVPLAAGLASLAISVALFQLRRIHFPGRRGDTSRPEGAA
jgi:hypothetical protein